MCHALTCYGLRVVVLGVVCSGGGAPGRVARWVFRESVAVSGGRVGSSVLPSRLVLSAVVSCMVTGRVLPAGMVGWVGTVKVVDVVDRYGSQFSGSWAPCGVAGGWWDEVDATVVRTENMVLEEA